MKRAEFVAKVAEKTGLTKSQAELAVLAFIDTLREIFETDDYIEFRGFGKFYVKERKGRETYHPATGEKVKCPRKKFLAFKPLKDVKIKY